MAGGVQCRFERAPFGVFRRGNADRLAADRCRRFNLLGRKRFGVLLVVDRQFLDFNLTHAFHGLGVIHRHRIFACAQVFKYQNPLAGGRHPANTGILFVQQRDSQFLIAGRLVNVNADLSDIRGCRRADGLRILRNRQAVDRAFQRGVRMIVIRHGDGILPCRKVGKFREGRIGLDGLGARPADERHHQRLGLNLHFARCRVIDVIARIRHLHADLLAVHRRIGHDLAIGVFGRLGQRVFVGNRHRTTEQRGIRSVGISDLHSINARLQPVEGHVGRAAEQRLFLFVGHRSVFMGQGDGDFLIAAAGDLNIQLEVTGMQIDVKLLILLGRGGRGFRGYRSHRTSAAGRSAASRAVAFAAGRTAAFAAGRTAAFAAGRGAAFAAGFGRVTDIGRVAHRGFLHQPRCSNLRFAQCGLGQRERRGRRKEHAYAQHHRNFAFHFISIHPDSLHDEKSLRVSTPSYHVSSLYATDGAAMRPLHTERTSAAISSHLAEIFY